MSHSLNKTLSPLKLWGIVVGMVISGMYFGWNYALQYTSPIGLIVAVLVVTLFYTTFMFSYAELSTAIPHAGGSMEFAKRTMGPFGGFITGFAAFLEFLFAVPAIALSAGAYINFLIPTVPAVGAAVAIYALFVFVNCLGVNTAAIVELFVTIIAILGIALYVAAGTGHIQINNIVTDKIFFGGLSGIFAAIPFGIWFYLGAEGGAMAAEECRNPKRDIPLGFNLGIITLAIMAILTLLITTGVTQVAKINNVDSPLPSALALIYGNGSFLSKALSFIGLFGLIASLHGLIIGYSRQAFAMAREGYFPFFLSVTTKKHKSPVWAIILPSLIGLIFVLTKATATIIVISVIGAVIMYIMSMISFFLLRAKEPKLERPYRIAHLALPVIALVIAFIFLVAVVWANWATMLWVLLTFAAAAVFYFAFSIPNMRKVSEVKLNLKLSSEEA
jgi:ethanolamine permease